MGARQQSASRTALTVFRVTSGNFLEMFDFFLFGFYAKPIGDAFFPVHDPVGRLLLAFLTFGAAFLMRPLGAILLGAYVDRVGRRKGLIATLAIMALGTFVIAATPSFGQLAPLAPGLGYAAPLLVLLGRLAQGFSAGVELGGVSVYLSEIAPPGRRGFYVAWQSASQQVAIIVAALIGYALQATLAPAQIDAWGWRIPSRSAAASSRSSLSSAARSRRRTRSSRVLLTPICRPRFARSPRAGALDCSA